MKKGILLLIVSVCFLPFLKSQGGFGYFMAGYSYTDWRPVMNDLSKSDLLGMIDIHRRGSTMGGGGFGRVGKHLLLGGKGYAGSFGKSSSPLGTLKASYGMGLFNFGYMLKQTKGFYFFGYGGVGGGGGGLEITNNSGKTMDLGTVKIEPGSKTNLGVGGMAMDFGLGTMHFFPYNNAGFQVGIQGGYSFFPGYSSWEDKNGQIATKLQQIQAGMWYLTLTIGGGGLKESD